MAEPFKNLLNAEVVETLSRHLARSFPEFPRDRFIGGCLEKLDTLELKDRAHLIADMIRECLPDDPQAALTILLELTRQIPPLEQEKSAGGWLMFPLNSYLSRYGLECFPRSLELVYEVTRRFTSEFAIRPFLINQQEETLRALTKWSTDPDENVRRLVSEGTRPRLPWAEQLPAFIADPSPILPLLETLKDDPSEYVRRSVANNLNDISKDNPERMLDVAEVWIRDADKNRTRLVKHACRSLIKAGHPRCLRILGYAAPKISVESFECSPRTLPLGSKVQIATWIRSESKRKQSIILDYRFHFVKANGKTAPKVFKGSLLSLAPGERREIVKSFAIKAVTTRRYYAGQTYVDLVANGQSSAKSSFELVV
ncbi:hypothetical protein [Pelagicoccus sp. SDUM812003]|uniref:hypothetical protein n=1 Tax=Pelagicoccus sp. SDUM812003 TaxID=3041267 RepID=UPI00280ED7B5|nr:hypothetical protein [Pelagicoccus sp. SDUM812003]MDQ8205211.1 hypothetical protein [Pelagicoccus sp. SDUM812003]